MDILRGDPLVISIALRYSEASTTVSSHHTVSEAQPLEQGNFNRTSANRRKPSKNKYRKYFTTVHRDNREVCDFSLKIKC
jgi:hypothetical protein